MVQWVPLDIDVILVLLLISETLLNLRLAGLTSSLASRSVLFHLAPSLILLSLEASEPVGLFELVHTASAGFFFV